MFPSIYIDHYYSLYSPFLCRIWSMLILISIRCGCQSLDPDLYFRKHGLCCLTRIFTQWYKVIVFLSKQYLEAHHPFMDQLCIHAVLHGKWENSTENWRMKWKWNTFIHMLQLSHDECALCSLQQVNVYPKWKTPSFSFEDSMILLFFFWSGPVGLFRRLLETKGKPTVPLEQLNSQ